jgi:hypothetical protein
MAQLLKEFIDFKDIKVIKEDVDVNGEKKKNYYLEGIMLQAGVKNRNNRIYPQDILQREVTNYVSEKVSKNLAVGTLDHGETPNIDLDRVSHVIVSLKMEGDNGLGKARILDTPCGRIAKVLIDEGIVLGMSTRGVGSLDGDMVKEDFQLLSIDLVNNPSAPKAFVKSVLENIDWEILGDKWVEVCKDGKCSKVKRESIVDKAVKELKEDVDKNASSKFMLEHVMNFLEKIKNKK